MRTSVPWILMLGLLAALGCRDSFEPYNELDGLRVLAVRAEPSDLAPEASTRLDALVVDPDAKPVSHAWSFCPWPSDPNDGFRCPVDQVAWQSAWRKAGLSGRAPSLALGEAEQAELSAPAAREELRTLCEVLLVEVASSKTLPPDCVTEWKWTVHLTVDDGQGRVDVVKDVNVVLDDAELNQNPELENIRIKQVVDPGVENPLRLEAEQEVEIAVAVAKDSAQLYVPRSALGEPPKAEEREALTFTWFVDAGSTDRMRSTFREGVESLVDATKNLWTPSATKDTATLFVVVRDHRGGVDFRSATVAISD